MNLYLTVNHLEALVMHKTKMTNLSGIVGIGNSRGYIELPKGAIERLIGRSLTFEDELVELE